MLAGQTVNPCLDPFPPGPLPRAGEGGTRDSGRVRHSEETALWRFTGLRPIASASPLSARARFTGAELVRLLVNHPSADIVAMTADRKAGQRIGEVFRILARR